MAPRDGDDEPFPDRGSRKIRGASYDLSDANRNAILNFPFAVYACYAEETCPTTGRQHLQFYLYCKNNVRLSTLRAHIKEAKFLSCNASHASNIMYVLKQRDQDYAENEANPSYDGNAATFFERGERPDEKRAAARTLESLVECQNYFIATQTHQPDWLREQWFGKLNEITDNLCHLMDVADFQSSDDSEMEDEEEDAHMHSPKHKKVKFNA